MHIVAVLRLAGAALVAALMQPAVSAPSYRLVNVDGFQAASSGAAGISANGYVTGGLSRRGLDDTTFGFSYRDGALELWGDTGSRTGGGGINSRGEVAGSTVATEFFEDMRPVIYAGGQMRELEGTGAALAINERGHATGTVRWVGPDAPEAFVYADDTGSGVPYMQRLGTLHGPASSIEGATSEGVDINDKGHVAGHSTASNSGPMHAFIWDGTTMHDIHSLGTTSFVSGISNAGHVTGIVFLDGAFTGFVYDGSIMHALGSLGDARTSGHAVNSSGVVVGQATTGSNTHRAFLFDGAEVLDLNLLVDESAAGWTLLSANDINDSGQIVGTGLVNGEYHAFLLVPVPEPGTYALMIAGLGAVLVVARRTRSRGEVVGHQLRVA